jgi:hypothetical protein
MDKLYGDRLLPPLLGPDGFDQDECASEGDECAVTVLGFITTHGNPLEALELAEGLFDAGAGFVQDFGKEGRLVLGVRAVRYHRSDAALARRLAVGFRIVALIGNRRPRRNIGAVIEQRFEILAIACLAAGQMKADRMALLVCF